MGPKLEDIDDLMHNILSRLPIEEAARTSVLSKSWLHAWSTIPTLRFSVLTGKQLKLIDMERTLIRYLRYNIPIETFTLTIDIENQESASHVAKLIGPMASKPFLKEISILIFLEGTSFMLPNEILASENLSKIKVSYPIRWNHSVLMTNTPVINCVSLRELHLDGVCMSEDVLNDILSYCKLLEKISLLYCCKGFKTIRVKNLSRLYKLKISLEKDDDNGCFTTLDIVNVPNLDVFSFKVHVRGPDMPLIPFNAHSIGSNVTNLRLGGMITDPTCLDKIKSGFPFVKCLTLGMESWKLESFHFMCSPSLKSFFMLSCSRSLTDVVQVHAPNLLFFKFEGKDLPSRFLFPVSNLKETTVVLSPNLAIDANFFVRMREALTLSCTFHFRIKIKMSNVVPMDIDHLRTRLVFPPATNMQSLWFETIGDEGVWERSLFFDAFFEICHPKYVYTRPDVGFKHNNHFSRLMLKEVLDKDKNETTSCWSHYLKHVKITRNWCKKWKTLRESHRSVLDGSVPGVSMYFNLNWC